MNCSTLLWQQFRYRNHNNNNNNNNNNRPIHNHHQPSITTTTSTSSTQFKWLIQPRKCRITIIFITIFIALVLLFSTTITTLSTSTTTSSTWMLFSKSRRYWVSAWISSPQHYNNHSSLWKNHPSYRNIGTASTLTTSTASTSSARTTFVTSNLPTRRTMTTTTATTNQMMNTAKGTTDMVDTTSTTTNTLESIPQHTTFRDSLQRRIVNSWIQQLDTETEEHYHQSLLESRISSSNHNNQTKRQVYNGHYVIVAPTPLPNPRLLLYSTDVAEQLLGFTSEQIHESDNNSTSNTNTNINDFVRFVAGHAIDLPSNIPPGWATPYALSIMGTRYTNNCPFGTGNAYGDGRAISIAEITTTTTTSPTTPNEENADGTVTSPFSYELQLKGGGTTPFHRGADGRAVLRSSIREFLASEAMYYLHVPTTRALSLVVSTTATIQRPWYKDQIETMTSTFHTNDLPPSPPKIPTMDDPRLAKYTIEQRKQIIIQMRRQNKQDPDILISEPCAITCRVSPSFVRIGHLDLFARRAVKASLSTSTYNTDSLAWKELEKMIWHACYREYRTEAYTPYIEQNDIASAATVFLEQSAHKLANMVAQWIRVGFAQGNFNADNCLVGGYTMDYGPFGFMEEYDPLFAKWTGSGQHFGFLNQPSAAFANYGVLVESVVPVIAAAQGRTEHDTIQNDFLEKAQEVFQNKVDEIFRIKLGFNHDYVDAHDVWEAMEPLLRNSRVDFTLFFRELSYMVRDTPNLFDDVESVSAETLLTRLIGNDSNRDGSSPFYEELTDEAQTKWKEWLQMWRSELKSSHGDNFNVDKIAQRMLQLNPKYVLREWMLVEAYQKATNENDESELLTLYNLIQHPYDEGTTYETNKYYRRAPDAALIQGGTAFMS